MNADSNVFLYWALEQTQDYLFGLPFVIGPISLLKQNKINQINKTGKIVADFYNIYIHLSV